MPQKGQKKRQKKRQQVQSAHGESRTIVSQIVGAGDSYWESAGRCPCLMEDDDHVQRCGEATISSTPAALEALFSWLLQAVSSSKAPMPHLHFSSAHEKSERALIHSVVEARFPAQLEAVSQGLGDRRTVAVFVKGHAPLPAFDETLRAQGAQLYKFAREAGFHQHSQDELVERLATGTLTEALKDLWDARSAEQEAMRMLLQAVTQNDASTIKEICTKMPGIVKAAHVDSSELPLMAAARLNCATAARTLLECGAPLEAKCPATNRTALKVARIFESTEAEAVLLQMGAHDPEAAAFPIPDQFSKTSNHSACSGGSSMLQVHKTAPLVTLPQGSGSRHPETGNDRTIEGDCSWGDSLWPRSGSGLSSRMMVAAAVVGLGLAAVYSLHRSRVGAQ